MDVNNFLVENQNILEILRKHKIVIDISKWQEGLDLEQFAGKIYGVMIKASEWNHFDEQFEHFVMECERLGIPWGWYHYTDSTSMDSVENYEKPMILKVHLKIQSMNCKFNLLPAVIDQESAGKDMSRVTVQSLTDITIALLDYQEELGYYAMLYTGYYFFRDNLDASRLKHYDKWFADYRDNDKDGSTELLKVEDFFVALLGFDLDDDISMEAHGMWQFRGVHLDVNVAYYDYIGIIKLKGLNGYVPEEPEPLDDFVVGDNVFSVNGVMNHLTIKADDEILDTISFGYKEVYDIQDFMLPSVTCVVNGNHFENHLDYDNYGENYGRSQSIICNKDDTPSPDGWYDVVAKTDDFMIGDMEEWQHPVAEGVTFGATVASIVAHDGELVKLESAYCVGSINRVYTQTYLVKFKDGCIGLGVSEAIKPIDIYYYLNEHNGGVDHLSFYDNGGSTQKVTLQSGIVRYTKRPIPQCMCFRKVFPEPTYEEYEEMCEKLIKANDEVLAKYNAIIDKNLALIDENDELRSKKDTILKENELLIAENQRLKEENTVLNKEIVFSYPWRVHVGSFKTEEDAVMRLNKLMLKGFNDAEVYNIKMEMEKILNEK